MAAVILSAVGNDDTLPSTRRHRRNVESLQIDSTHNVAMETNPKTSKRVDRKSFSIYSLHSFRLNVKISITIVIITHV